MIKGSKGVVLYTDKLCCAPAAVCLRDLNQWCSCGGVCCHFFLVYSDSMFTLHNYRICSIHSWPLNPVGQLSNSSRFSICGQSCWILLGSAYWKCAYSLAAVHAVEKLKKWHIIFIAAILQANKGKSFIKKSVVNNWVFLPTLNKHIASIP